MKTNWNVFKSLIESMLPQLLDGFANINSGKWSCTMQCVHWLDWKFSSSSQVLFLHWLQVGLMHWFQIFCQAYLFIAECDPWMQLMADLSSENINWHLSQEYACALFSGRSEASHWYMTVGALPMLPAAEMTSGVKGPCSTSLTLYL